MSDFDKPLCGYYRKHNQGCDYLKHFPEGEVPKGARYSQYTRKFNPYSCRAGELLTYHHNPERLVPIIPGVSIEELIVVRPDLVLDNKIAHSQARSCDKYTDQPVDTLPPPPIGLEEDRVETPPTNPFLGLDINSFKVGDIMPVKDFQEIDPFFNWVRELLRDQNRNVALTPARSVSTAIEKDLLKRRFFGPRKSFRVTRQNPEEGLAFMVSFELWSSGRGKIADYDRYVATYITEEDEKQVLKRHTQLLTSRGQLRDIAEVVNEASINWQAAQRWALRNKVSGGLPSLGKKR